MLFSLFFKVEAREVDEEFEHGRPAVGPPGEKKGRLRGPPGSGGLPAAGHRGDVRVFCVPCRIVFRDQLVFAMLMCPQCELLSQRGICVCVCVCVVVSLTVSFLASPAGQCNNVKTPRPEKLGSDRRLAPTPGDGPIMSSPVPQVGCRRDAGKAF